MLDILEYLHSHSPPVLHRDIKPANIILKPGDGYEKSDLARPDERGNSHCMLVDFGAVQTAASSTVGGSTVVGTPGYMPLEQLQGRAVPATDLYGLAATLAHLASGIDPSDMDVIRGKIQVPDGLLEGRVGRVIQACLEPHVEDPMSGSCKTVNQDATRTVMGRATQQRVAPPRACILKGMGVSQDAEFGRVRQILDQHGGADVLQETYETVASYHGGNYRPLLWKIHRRHRVALFRLLTLLAPQPATQDVRLIEAWAFVLSHRRAKKTWLVTQIDLSFVSRRWEAFVRARQDGQSVNNRRNWKCVFSATWLGQCDLETSSSLAPNDSGTGVRSCCHWMCARNGSSPTPRHSAWNRMRARSSGNYGRTSKPPLAKPMRLLPTIQS